MKVEDLNRPPSQQDGLKIMRKVQSDLWDMEVKLEDLAWSLDAAVVALEEC